MRQRDNNMAKKTNKASQPGAVRTAAGTDLLMEVRSANRKCRATDQSLNVSVSVASNFRTASRELPATRMTPVPRVAPSAALSVQYTLVCDAVARRCERWQTVLVNVKPIW